jgi:hypothetical protein
MNKFRIEGTDIWFGYTEENHDKQLNKAYEITQAHPDSKIIYEHVRPVFTSTYDRHSNATITEEPAVPASSKKAKAGKETVQLPDLHGNVDDDSTGDSVLES